ncbi:uncharacterized protein A4U43_C01F21340 [Asparagus officinalis]|uniref:RNase H type-1 domain-containing protein n=1 Tax=Asparagus officinalis TaxID=4686 RepID=A0A5P1FRV9_ASPOF|nr:uncharacterized protein A4U43_C01F21340 [Asparagus officinalis]
MEIVSSHVGGGDLIRDVRDNWLGRFMTRIGSCSASKAELWGLLYSLQIAWDVSSLDRGLLCDIKELMHYEWEDELHLNLHEDNYNADLLSRESLSLEPVFSLTFQNGAQSVSPSHVHHACIRARSWPSNTAGTDRGACGGRSSLALDVGVSKTAMVSAALVELSAILIIVTITCSATTAIYRHLTNGQLQH